MRDFPAFHAIIAAVIGSMVLVNAGCEQDDRSASAPQPPPAPLEAADPGPTDGMVAVPDEQHDAQLLAAIHRARDTADAARQRWLETPPTQRHRWTVKWRAPTVGGIKGLGESGLIASQEAVVNAVVDALAPFDPNVGALALSPDRLLRSIGLIPN